MKEVTVTHVNGDVEVYRTQEWRAQDGLLMLFSPNDISKPDRFIPLINVRDWSVE